MIRRHGRGVSLSALVALAAVAGPAWDPAWAQSRWGGRKQAVGGRSLTLDMRETPEAVTINFAADVLFDFDRADLKPEAEAALDKAAEVIRKYGGAGVLVAGHTDSIGTPAHNQKLSEARAASVKEWLVTGGHIAADRIATQGWGATRPVAPNTNPDGSDNPGGRQKNRRVEITIRKS